MRALISIDYTNDFVADDGALTTGEAGQSIETALVNVTKEFLEQKEYVVFAIDRHEDGDLYHPETKLFPPHNLENTAGRRLYGKLADVYEAYRHQDQCYWLDKRRYSAFCGTDLDVRLRERKVQDLYLTGVCTDICVLHTAVDAYNLGYRLFIVKNAVASFDPTGHEWALKHFQNTLGAQIV